MKTSNRRKTLGFERNNALELKRTRKHNSTFSFLQEEAGRIVVLDIIQHLLGKVHEEERQRTKFLAFMMKKLVAMEAEDAFYFNLEQGDGEEILCHQDAEPPAQENRSLEVVKKVKHLKKSSKLKFGEQSLDQSQVNEISRIVDPDKKDRDSIIQKLKREYSMILQSKYLSESTPISESRTFFMEGDTPEITSMRSNFGKSSTKKTQKHKPSFVQQEIRKHHKLDTIFKKSRDYVETIDPTMSNSMYLSQIQPQTSSNRASVVNPPLSTQQPAVVVKVLKLKEVTNVISPKNEVVSQKNIVAERQRNTRLTNLVVEQERQSLKLRVERSFHSSNKTHFREVHETQRKPKLNNAISVGFLPRISRI